VRRRQGLYVEKPLTHDLSEGPAVIAAQNGSSRMYKWGTQQRSMPAVSKSLRDHQVRADRRYSQSASHWIAISRAGSGTSSTVDPKTVDWKMFLGTAREQPFARVSVSQLALFWDFGGGILTDLMVHFIDIAHGSKTSIIRQTATTIA